MGATLPVISRWVDSTPRGGSPLGLFYAGNILGGVAGCLIAGFYLLRVYDMNVATYVAVTVNVIVAGASWLFARNDLVSVRLKPDTTTDGEPRPLASNLRPPDVALLICIALSGFCALAAEVVWTRMLSLIFSATVYTFSIILAVFLIGLGLGSAIGSAVSRRVMRPAIALGWCQWLTVGAILWSAEMLARSLPYWPVINSASAVAEFRLDIVRALWAILPAPILWGASFR
jgi:spermidine synthase